MRLLHTMLIGFGTVAAMIVLYVTLVGLAHMAYAQNEFFDPWGSERSIDPYGSQLMDDHYARQERTRARQERQERMLNEGRFANPRIEETDEYRSWDRLRGLEGCNALTNNPAARSRCLQGLR